MSPGCISYIEHCTGFLCKIHKISILQLSPKKGGNTMQVPPDHNRHMAMLKAALPYAMPESRRAIEIMLQADALIHTARGQSDERYSLEAAGLSLEDPAVCTGFHTKS